MSERIDNTGNDINIVNERLRALDACINVPEAAGSEALLKKLEGVPKPKGRVLGFRFISTAAAAVFVIAAAAVIVPRLGGKNSAVAPRDAEEYAMEAAMEECAPESSSAAAKMGTTMGSAGEGQALATAADGYSELRTALQAMFDEGTAELSVQPLDDGEVTLEYKYREISVEDDGDSVSVLIFDKENGGALMKGFWVQGEYAGSENSGSDSVTLMTKFAVTESSLNSNSFVPMCSGEDNLPVQIAAENITIAQGASRAVYTIYVDIDLESGRYTVRAELG